MGGFTSVVVTAVAFAGVFAIGGTAPADPATLAAAMAGVHAFIGIGEGVLTALVVGSVLAVRPDLVHANRRRNRRLREHAAAADQGRAR